jgi:hypothetical protein
MRAHDSVILISAFGPSPYRQGYPAPTITMPSADFCVLTRHVAMKGATGSLMSCCLFCVFPKGNSHPSTANGCAGYLVNRVNLFRTLLINLLSRDAQISPDKSVNFPCTNAAFTLSPEPAGFVVLCQLAQGLSLVCGFCPSSRTFAIRLPSDPSSRRRPCLRLVLLVVFITMKTSGFSYRGLAPHKFTPVPGVHQEFETDGPSAHRSTAALMGIDHD